MTKKSKVTQDLVEATQEKLEYKKYLFALTSHLNSEQMLHFTGRNAANLKKLREGFLNLPIFVSNNRIATSQEEIDARSGRDPGLASRLANVCFQLESIVRNDKAINAVNIEQAIDEAFKVQEDSFDNVTQITKEGKKIDKKNIIIPELENSVLFESFVSHASCPEDTSIPSSQTIFFTPSGKNVYSRILGEYSSFLKEIINHVEGIKIKSNKGKSTWIKIIGDEDKIVQASNYIITFANLITEFGYRKKEHLQKALACAFGDITPEELPNAKTATKKGEKSTFDPATITVNEFEPSSENQQRYVDMIENNKYPAVMTQGPAGTGKTRLFLQTAMRKIRDHYSGVAGESFGKLLLSIPLVNVGGKDLGAMPGGLAQKTGMWFESYYSHLVRILSPQDAQGKPDLIAGTEVLEALKAADIIEIAPLEFLRGRSFEGAMIALDEAQNATAEQTRTFLTRAEETSRLFVFGDLEQTDRSIEKTPKGESFKVPSTVKIDKEGITYIYNNGRWVEIGFHKDIGHFLMGTKHGHIEKVYPRNGFAQALLLYSGSPNIGCTSLDFSDIRRSGVARDLLVLHRGLRIVGDDGTSLAPIGDGNIDPLAILARQDALDAVPNGRDKVVKFQLGKLNRRLTL